MSQKNNKTDKLAKMLKTNLVRRKKSSKNKIEKK